ncbi:MAG: hypothetical protein ABIO82_00415 [Ginsengibacter sp.]
MGYIIFVLYVFLFCFLLTRLSFFKNSGLGSRTLIILFLIKILAGLANAYINVYHYPVSDALEFHQQGLEEYHLLWSNPVEYLTNIFKSNYSNYSGFLESSDSFWNDLRTNIIAKTLSVFDIFSFENFFVNNLFFDFLVFFGAVYLYRVFIKAFRLRKALIIACVFLLPSVLYFTSGIHRDGFIFIGLSIIVYHFYFILEEKNISWKRIFSIMFFLCLILLLRSFVFITLVPALIGWIISSRYSKSAMINYLSVYLVSIAIFFATSWLGSTVNLPKYVSEKQSQFVDIAKRGTSSIDINILHPTFKSFWQNTPQAFINSLMRPFLTEMKDVLYIPSAIEILAYELLFLLFIFFRKSRKLRAFDYFCIFLALGMFLIIGFTIPILGAIVRYRSIYFPFLILPLISFINWKKLIRLFRIN